MGFVQQTGSPRLDRWLVGIEKGFRSKRLSKRAVPRPFLFFCQSVWALSALRKVPVTGESLSSGRGYPIQGLGSDINDNGDFRQPGISR